MVETINRGAVEAEIAQLSRQIEEKRRTLEAGHGVIEERELVRHVVGEQISQVLSQATGAAAVSDPQATTPAPTVQTTATKATPTYLDTLDDETVAKINALVQSVFQQGIKKTITTVVEEDPFILDAFHDALVDKLYDELKKQKIVS